jgi:site-specific DNA-methyltransferase (adenine-specific)
MFCNTRFGYDLIQSNPSWYRYDLVWDKARGINFLDANRRPMASHEMVYVFSKRQAYYKRIEVNDRVPLTVIHNPTTNGRGRHPTEKPVELYRWLLERYCVDGGTVLDPTAGSCNSVMTARELGMKGIGIEKDRGYFYKAVAKVANLSRNLISHL